MMILYFWALVVEVGFGIYMILRSFDDIEEKIENLREETQTKSAAEEASKL